MTVLILKSVGFIVTTLVYFFKHKNQ